MSASTIKPWLEKYLRHLESEKGRAALTITHYRDYLERFLNEMQVRAPIDIKVSTIHRFKKSLARSDVGMRTQNYHLIALRNFVRFLPKARQPLHYKAIALHRTNYRPRRQAPVKLIKQAVTSPDRITTRAPIVRARDRAILEILYMTDVKLYQLARLSVSDFAPSRSQITVRERNRRDRRITLPPASARLISTYLDQRSDPSPFLFIAHDRARHKRTRSVAMPITTRSIQRLVASAARQIGSRGSITPRTIQQA